MKIGMNEISELGLLGTTVFDTDDYAELKGKTVDEIKHMDFTTVLTSKTKEGKCLIDTIPMYKYDYTQKQYVEVNADDLI